MTEPTIDYKTACDMQAKRLARYPIQVRKIKRLRRQIVGLNRCIRDEKEYSEWMFKTLMGVVNDMKPSNTNMHIVFITGVLCFLFGLLLG